MDNQQCAGLACVSGQCLRLSEREQAVCSIVCSSESPVTFGRMKEQLHLHQEKLTRVLKRLAFYGCVDRTQSGWIGFCCH